VAATADWGNDVARGLCRSLGYAEAAVWMSNRI
jgi:hypothetical protein